MPATKSEMPAKTLDYTKCTEQELRKFIRDRMPLAKQCLWKLHRDRRGSLVSRLQKMDRNKRFPTFLNLPLEIRLEVYRHMLAGGNVEQDTTELYPALLRVSKLVYSEAEEVLYSENRFSVRVDLYHGGSGRVCYVVTGPGRSRELMYRSSDGFKLDFPQVRDVWRYNVLSHIRHLTIHLGPKLIGALCERVEACLSLCEEQRTRCLELPNISQLKKITVAIEGPDRTFENDELTVVPEPLKLLDTGAVIDFKDMSADSEAKAESQFDSLLSRQSGRQLPRSFEEHVQQFMNDMSRSLSNMSTSAWY